MEVKILRLISLVVLFIFGMLTPVYAAIDPGTIVGMWLFDEGDDIAIDSSGNENDGELVGDLKWVDGKFDKALQFDGQTTYVDCGNAESFNITGDLTITAWVKITNNVRSFLVGKGTSNNDNTYFMGTGSGSMWLFGAGDGTAYKHTVATVAEPVDVWRHVAGVKSDTTFTIYLDGVSNKSSTITLQPFKNVASLLIGRWWPNSSDYSFKGIIDEFAIFNVAIEEQDIQTIMNQGLKGSISAVGLSSKLTTTWGSIKKG